VHPAVVALPPEDKGFVLGALLARLAPETVAAQLGGAAGARCAEAVRALIAETKPVRAAALAALIALARAAVPAGLDRVHPGWVRERLERETTLVIRIATTGLSAGIRRVAADVLAARGENANAVAPAIEPAGVTELQRLVFAGLVPMAGPGAPVGATARGLLELPEAGLTNAIELRGAETLGRSLRGAPGAVIARAAAGVGEPLGRAVVAAAAQAGVPEERERARALVGRASAGAGSNAAWEIGARALAVDLADEGVSAMIAIAQRLPPDRGRRLLAAAET